MKGARMALRAWGRLSVPASWDGGGGPGAHLGQGSSFLEWGWKDGLLVPLHGLQTLNQLWFTIILAKTHPTPSPTEQSMTQAQDLGPSREPDQDSPRSPVWLRWGVSLGFPDVPQGTL